MFDVIVTSWQCLPASVVIDGLAHREQPDTIIFDKLGLNLGSGKLSIQIERHEYKAFSDGDEGEIHIHD